MPRWQRSGRTGSWLRAERRLARRTSALAFLNRYIRAVGQLRDGIFAQQIPASPVPSLDPPRGLRTVGSAFRRLPRARRREEQQRRPRPASLSNSFYASLVHHLLTGSRQFELVNHHLPG